MPLPDNVTLHRRSATPPTMPRNPPPLPAIRTIGLMQPMTWLVLAWRDMAQAGWISFAHGLALTLFGAAIFAVGHHRFWLLAGDSVGDTDLNVDVALALGAAGAVLSFIFSALSELIAASPMTPPGFGHVRTPRRN